MTSAAAERRSVFRVVRAVVLALGVAALAAGCGGGGRSNALTHEEFVKQADAICANANNRLKALGSPTGPSDFAPWAKKLRPIGEEGVGKLAKLTPPKKDAADAAAYIALLRQSFDLIGGPLADAVKRNDPAAEQKLALSLKAARDRGVRIKERLGLTGCGKQS